MLAKVVQHTQRKYTFDFDDSESEMIWQFAVIGTKPDSGILRCVTTDDIVFLRSETLYDSITCFVLS